MRFYKKLAIILLLAIGSDASAQDVYEAGFGSESILPGNESFSLALAGYAAPWDGRFTLNWKPKGLAKNFSDITESESNTVSRKFRKSDDFSEFVQTRFDNDRAYGLAKNGTIKKADIGQKKLFWASLPILPNTTSFVVQNPYIYASTGSDTLWKIDADHPGFGWQKAGYYNGFTEKVKIKKLYSSASELFAVNDADSLFEAGKNYGEAEEEPFVRAMAIGKDKKTTLLICLDLCGFNGDFTNEIKAELSGKSGLPADAILVNASHTHFMPGTQAWLTWASHNRRPDRNYLNRVVRPAILKAAETALAKMKPSTIYFGRGTTAIGQNRSNAGSPFPYDNAVDVVKVISQDGNDQTVMVLAGCHPVGGKGGQGHFTLSSNYPGYMRNILEKTAGKNTRVMFVQGCGGDINPLDEPDVSGQKLATDAMKVLTQSMTPLKGQITYSLDTLVVPASPMPRQDIEKFKTENSRLVPGMEPERNVAWADLMLKKYGESKMPGELPVLIQTVNIGNWKLVGLSRETVTEYSIAIKKIWPEKLVSVAGYCNDVSSYLPVERHIRTGVYEGKDSFIWYGQPSSFPLNILDLVLNRIREKNY